MRGSTQYYDTNTEVTLYEFAKKKKEKVTSTLSVRVKNNKSK